MFNSYFCIAKIKAERNFDLCHLHSAIKNLICTIKRNTEAVVVSENKVINNLHFYLLLYGSIVKKKVYL